MLTLYYLFADLLRGRENLFDYFWTYATDLPPDIGVETFGPTHLRWVSASALFIIMAILIYRKQNKDVRRKIQVSAAIFMIAGTLIRWIWAASIGHYSIAEMLPLHLCTMSVIVEFAAVISKNLILKEFSYAVSLPGAVASIITPLMGPYPFCSYYYLEFAATHTILVTLPLLWILVDGFRPDFHRLPACFAILVAFAGAAAIVNRAIGSNYMFIRYAPKGTPLEIFEKWCGTPGYLIPTILLLLLIWIVLYIPWRVRKS